LTIDRSKNFAAEISQKIHPRTSRGLPPPLKKTRKTKQPPPEREAAVSPIIKYKNGYYYLFLIE
jgi:hypothetical protein